MKSQQVEVFKKESSCFQFTFGVDDDGTVIDDVELPRWASTPEQFIMLHRAVSEQCFARSNCSLKYGFNVSVVIMADGLMATKFILPLG